MRAIWLLLVLLLSSAAVAQPFPGDLPGTNIGGGLPAGFESSGAVWHRGLSQLFIVHDNGQVARIEASGGFPQIWTIGGDLEAICAAAPESSFIYLGRENPDAVLEFDLTLGAVTRAFDLTGFMTGAANEGLEALTFVPIDGHTEGGLFLAGHQGEGNVYAFELPIVTSSTATTVTHVRTFAPVPGRADLSGLDYNRDTDRLYALYDTANRIVQMASDGTFITEWTAPGNDQEGIAVRGCELFIAQDDSPVFRYTTFPDATVCHALSADTMQLSLQAGGPVNFDLRVVGSIQPASRYILVGSASGTSPGITVGALFLPLNRDAYFDLMLAAANQTPFIDTYRTFDATGLARARLEVPPGLPSSLAGITLHHAFVAKDPATSAKAASNTQRLTLVP